MGLVRETMMIRRRERWKGSHKTLTPEQLMRLYLPYGRWVCRDARNVLFNRYYDAIWEGPPATPADPMEWIVWIDQKWYYDDNSQPWKHAPILRECLRILRDFGATWEPLKHIPAIQKAEKDL